MTPPTSTATKPRYSISWSLDENHVYLDDDILDERLVDIHFTIGGSDQSKKRKWEILNGIVMNLDLQEPKQ